MTDICKCSGKGCPHKENCYRYTAPEGMLQMYYLNPPITEDGKCDHFWGENQEAIWDQLKSIVNGQTR